MMTPKQVGIARHALGLNRAKKSFRNRYVVGPACDGWDDCMAMVEAGWATRRPALSMGPLTGGDDLFSITFEGARLVLKDGESL